MKQFLTALVALLLLNSCGPSDNSDDSTSGFDAVLDQPPFKTISDSIRQFPENSALLFKRAELLSQNNQHDIAYYDYKKSWELSHNENIALAYASSLFLTGRNKEAVLLLKKCSDTFPNNADLKRRLGEAYIQTGQQAEALALYDNILKIDSTNFEALYEKGLLYTQLKDTTKAIGLLEKVYRAQPTLQTALALANLYAETGNAKTIALCDFLQSRDSTKEFVEPVFLKGIYYSNLHLYEKAMQQFYECKVRDYRFSLAYIENAIVLYEQKKYKEALQDLDYLIQGINYGDPDAYFWKGRCLEAQGKHDEAMDSYYMALSFDRNFKEAHLAIERLKKK